MQFLGIAVAVTASFLLWVLLLVVLKEPWQVVSLLVGTILFGILLYILPIVF